MKGAYFEVLSDMLGSLGVIVAAAIVMFTGWTLADPIIGAGIGLFIVPRTWILLRQATHILMEGTPPEVDIALLEQRLLEIPGVTAVHDLHVWTITSGLDAMSCHLVVAEMAQARTALFNAQETMKAVFGLTHTTIQIEDQRLRDAEGEKRLEGHGNRILSVIPVFDDCQNEQRRSHERSQAKLSFTQGRLLQR